MIKGIEDNLKKWKYTLYPWIRRINIFKLAILPKAICRLNGKESACNAGDTEGHDITHQYSCRENPMDRGAWWATVHRVAMSQTQLTTSINTPMTFFTESEQIKIHMELQKTPNCHSHLEKKEQIGAITPQTSEYTTKLQ